MAHSSSPGAPPRPEPRDPGGQRALLRATAARGATASSPSSSPLGGHMVRFGLAGAPSPCLTSPYVASS